MDFQKKAHDRWTDNVVARKVPVAKLHSECTLERNIPGNAVQSWQSAARFPLLWVFGPWWKSNNNNNGLKEPLSEKYIQELKVLGTCGGHAA